MMNHLSELSLLSKVTFDLFRHLSWAFNLEGQEAREGFAEFRL